MINTDTTADAWLGAELDRIWLLAERALRSLQHMQLRPPPTHPAIAEVEAMLTARRIARLGPGRAAPDGEASLSAAIANADAQLAGSRGRAPIDRLITNLELRPLEVETLLITMAPHVEPPLADVLNLVKGPTPGKRGVDLGLVAQLLRLSRTQKTALLDVLDPDRPLLRWRLVQIQPGESFEAFSSMSHRALRPTFDAVSTLCGRSELAPELTRIATLSRGEATLEDLRFDDAMRTELERVCDAARTDGAQNPWLVLYGPAGSGKCTIAERIAAFADRPLLAFDALAVERVKFDDVLARVQREALIRGAVLYIGSLAGPILDHGGREIARRLAGYKGQIILGIEGSQPPRLIVDHAVWEVQVKLPSEPVRAQLWHDALPALCRADDLQLDQLARAFLLTPGEIHRAAREAIVIANRDRGRKISHANVRSGVERRLRNDLGELARRIPVTGSWHDLVLPPQDMGRVEEFISRKRWHEVVYEQWGYGERLGYGKGLIALFSGPPGTGKTMLASLIAKALDLDLYQVDLGLVVSRWVGETEKQLSKVFDLAERAHAVLLFDEADSLFAKRTEVTQANDRFANMATNYLLQRLEQYSGIAVLTTNKDAALDEALQRRLTLHLRLDVPEIAERERLWQSFLPALAPVRPDIDLNELATEFELSGGYIKNAAVRAAFLAAAAGGAIDMEILRLASALELEDMGRVVCLRRSDA